MVFKKGSHKIEKKKLHTIHEDVKKLKYVITIKMYINSNSVKLQITNLKRLRLKTFRFTDCLIAWLRELKSLMA